MCCDGVLCVVSKNDDDDELSDEQYEWQRGEQQNDDILR
jgi:hypothetical protein